MSAGPPARWPWIPMSRSRRSCGWCSGCSMSWARCMRCCGSWCSIRCRSGCGSGPVRARARSPGGRHISRVWSICCATRPMPASTPTGAAAPTRPGACLAVSIPAGCAVWTPGRWLVRIEDALPAYISVEQYERNLARLAANRARAESPGAPREGPALLGGLVVCGICGHRLQVNYEASGQGLTGRYCCHRRHHTYGEPRCQQMAARFIDDHVVAQVLSALAPAALELSVTAAAQVETRRAEVDRIWRQRLERADFACDRARRQYQLAEPENRLVARQLEREWEAALAERAHLGEEYERYQRARPARLSAAELAAIRALAGDIPALWAAPTTTVADRKRLLRAVIESVQVTAEGATERVQATVTWAGGHQSRAALSRPVARIDQLSYYPALTERISALARQGLDSTAIAGQLAAEGFRTPRLHDRFHPAEIQHLIRRLGLRPGLDHDHCTDQGSLIPASGGWPPWPARSACQPRPCSGGSDAAGSAAGKTPGRLTGGSSPQTPPKSNASARCTR